MQLNKKGKSQLLDPKTKSPGHKMNLRRRIDHQAWIESSSSDDEAAIETPTIDRIENEFNLNL